MKIEFHTKTLSLETLGESLDRKNDKKTRGLLMMDGDFENWCTKRPGHRKEGVAGENRSKVVRA